MRKAFLLVALISCFLLTTGCGKKLASPQTLRWSFSAHAEISFAGGAVNCRVERAGIDAVTYTLEEETPAKLQYIWDGNSFSIAYADLCTQSAALPDDNFAVTLNRFLDYAARQDSLTPISETELSGSLNGTEFTLMADEQGRVTALSVPETGFHARFSYTDEAPALGAVGLFSTC